MRYASKQPHSSGKSSNSRLITTKIHATTNPGRAGPSPLQSPILFHAEPTPQNILDDTSHDIRSHVIGVILGIPF